MTHWIEDTRNKSKQQLLTLTTKF